MNRQPDASIVGANATAGDGYYNEIEYNDGKSDERGAQHFSFKLER